MRDRLKRFCAPESSLVVPQSHFLAGFWPGKRYSGYATADGSVQDHHHVTTWFLFMEISDNISETVQDRGSGNGMWHTELHQQQ